MSSNQIAINQLNQVLVASVQIDLTEQVLEAFASELLERLHHAPLKGILIDLSGIKTLDKTSFERLVDVTKMASVMGANTVFVGMRPGIVFGLIEVEANLDGVVSVASLEQGLERLDND